MSQYKTGTASVTNGSAVVTGSGTLWASNVSVGDGFVLSGVAVPYTVASVDNDGQITLSAPWAGSTTSGSVYAIFRDFTTNEGLPELSRGDIETATIWTRALRLIDAAISGVGTSLQGQIDSNDTEIQAIEDARSAEATREALLNEATLAADFANNKYQVYEGPVNSLSDVAFGAMWTFTRSSAATAKNANQGITDVSTDERRLIGNREGLLLEDARTNLVDYPRRFNFGWTENVATILSDYKILAPDGTLTGTIINVDGSSGGIYQTVNVSAGEQYTGSVYWKAGTIAVEDMRFTFYDDTNNAFITSSSGIIPTTLEDAGNGWFRASHTVTTPAGCTLLRFYPIRSSVVTSGTFHLWHTQVEAGTVATSPVVPNTAFTGRSGTATFLDSTGVLQTAGSGVARDDAYGYDENGVLWPIGLLLEGASTNVVRHSEELDDAIWSKNETTITANAVSAPDGATTADKVIANTTDARHYVGQGGLNVSAGVEVTFSYYVRPAEYSKTRAVIVGSGMNTKILNLNHSGVGTDWERKSFTFNTEGATTLNAQVDIISDPGDATYAGDGSSGLYLWGLQLEELPYATSYTPTAGSTASRAADVSSSSQVTRAEDVCTRALAEDFNLVELTLYWEGFVETPGTPAGGSRGVCLIPHPTQANRGIGVAVTVSDNLQIGIRDDIENAATVVPKPAGLIKAAVSVKGNTILTALNGVVVDESPASHVFNLAEFTPTLKLMGQEFLLGGLATSYGPQVNRDARIFPRAYSLSELATLTGG